jgi:hypothetical protein
MRQFLACLTRPVQRSNLERSYLEANVVAEKQLMTFSRSFGGVMAFLLLLQVAFAGVAVASNGSAQGGFFGPICANAQSPGSDETPAAPNGGHKHKFCCILHCSALNAPPPKSEISYVLSFPVEPFSPRSVMVAPALRMEPRRAPQSPRAPPHVS